MEKRIFTFLMLLVTLFATTSAQRTFNHPGGILSTSDLERIKTHVNAGDEPWASCWRELQGNSLAQSTYTARPLAEIGGSDGQRQRAAADAYAAILNAIQWHVTGNEKYARCAAKILTDWGNTLESASWELYQYPSRALILAAEMLRTPDGFYEGWAEADRDRFLGKVRTILYPACKNFCTAYGTHPSWYTPAALGVLAAGVLLDDEAIYNEGYNLMLDETHWGTMYGGSIEPSGQMREMGRDNVHGGLTLGDIAQACLTAWNQGDDLFAAGDNRLLRGMEYWCRYNTGHKDTPFEPLNCDGLDNATGYSFYFISTHDNSFRLRPDACCFEAVYHHYKEVKGMDAEKEFPYLSIAAKLARPDTSNQLLGFGTLFFTIDANASPYFTEKPAQPVDVKAEDGFKRVYLSWQHPQQEDARGFRIYRSTDSKSFTLLTTQDYYTHNEYVDTNVETGKTYYYRVQLINKAGYSEQSDIVSATPQAGTDVLPSGWSFMSIGSAVGGAVFTEAQDTTIAVSGVGTDIGGTADSQGFVYRKMTGDATLTVRLGAGLETYYKVGIQMRGTLDAGAQRMGITLGEKGYRMCRTGIRSTANANTTWINGTNYGKIPIWMRIRREGNKFTTYISHDGKKWHQIGQATLSMAKDYYVGLASCSGSTSTQYQAIFDHVSIEGTKAEATSRPSVPSGLTVAWSDTDEASISWSAVADADSFRVHRLKIESPMTDTELRNATYDCIAAVRTTYYIDTEATAGTYAYRISAFNSVGESNPCTARQVTTAAAEKITGTIIGTPGSYKNNSSTTCRAALDGSLSTYFDAAEASGAWVGYDLGEDRTAELVYVKYAPRSSYPARMTGGKFQASHKEDFSTVVTIATITETPDEGKLTQLLASTVGKDYRYLRYIGPDNGNCNVAEVQFYGRIIPGETTDIRVPSGDTSSVSSQTYYDLNGCIIPDPHRNPGGILIRRTCYTDGTVKVEKCFPVLR